jgi:hypothetical protein
MAKQLHYDVRLPPAAVLERLASATVRWEDIADLRSPLGSYVKFVAESLAGPREFVARIDGAYFRITPIGIRPFKGRSWTAPVGWMEGCVEAAGGGARVTARFRINPWYPVVFAAWFAVLALLAVPVLLMATAAGVKPEDRTWTLTLLGAMAAGGLAFVGVIWVNGRSQERVIAEFLGRLLGDVGP